MIKIPLPKPKKNENKSDFISRCASDKAMNEEYPDAKQKLAVCYSLWERRNKGKKMKNISKSEAKNIMKKLSEVISLVGDLLEDDNVGNVEKAETIEKAKWDSGYISSLPDSAFAYVENCYGKTTNDKRARHLPYKDKNGKIDLPHLRNALARVNQIKPFCKDTNKAEMIATARKRLEAAKKKVGMK